MKIVIRGMVCGHCQKRVESALKNVEGIDNFKVNLKENNAEIEGNFSKEKVKEAIEEMGFEVVSMV